MTPLPRFASSAPFRLSVMLVAIVLLGSACVPSLHPFYTENDLADPSMLIGRWQRGESGWSFAAGEKGALDVRIKDGAKHAQFVGHLFKIKDRQFLDLTLDNLDLPADQSDLIRTALIPAHIVLRVEMHGTKVALLWTNPDWLDKYLTAHATALAHYRANGKHLVLTADTPALQSFVHAHASGGLFGDASDEIDQTFERISTS